MAQRMRRVRDAAAALTATAAVAVVTVLVLAPGDGGEGGAEVAAAAAAKAAPGVNTGPVAVEAEDNLPSWTAGEWVTYADHVVVVTATSQSEIAPQAHEIERGEGIVGRNVMLKIDKVLWSRADAAKPAPATWNSSALGWHFTESNLADRREMVVADRPRMEVGHTYILAMEWDEARCSEGDETVPAQWRGLGAGSELPYDGGVIGNGEQAGRTQSVSRAKAPRAQGIEAEAVVEEVLAGQPESALVSALKAAKPVPTDGYLTKTADSAKAACA
ncbi:hypothetical protein ACFT9I_05895 [Streptomyces sp. NPDC057137]|uniref:hypothetical protein n=1 Tax=Streptomyces sp. NPDC057137 TaxID=3346030 RepID=UPI00362892FA